MKVSLTEQEMAALYGLPHSAVCLYVMAIRPRMDYTTGKVGEKPRISWHTLTEWLYVEPRPGPGAHGSLSIEQVRRLARHLVRAGLLRMRSIITAQSQQLIFECVLARRDPRALSLVQIQPDRDPTGAPDREPDRAAQSEKRAKPDRQPDRGKRSQPDAHPVLSSTSTTTPCGSASTAPDGAGTHSALIFPQRLTAAERRLCSERVSGLNASDAQTLIDELTGAIQGGQEIRTPSAYLRALVARFRAGTFTPERAVIVQEARAYQERVSRELEGSDDEPPTASDRARLPSLKAELQRMRTGGQGDGIAREG